ncbi:Xaa-Pro peptidase family protein, partial [Patescibacteria group bacterium]|nr:Xaa-Pro peptidase family protein [Patescibacteria group bacterium]
MEEKRLEKIQEKLKKENLDAFLVSNPSNIFYLTGLRGELKEREFLLNISRDGWKIIVPEMYSLEVKRKTANFSATKERGGLFDKAIEGLKNYKRIGFEKNDLKYGEYENLSRNLSSGKLFPISGFCEDLRKIKDKEEIGLIKKAVEIADKTFYTTLKIIKPGLSEKFIQRKLIEIMEDLGAEGPAFLPIIASGKGSAEPHHWASNKKIKKGEILLIDMGAKYKGYCSDLTRTIFVGKAPQRFKKIYNLVLETQKMAIKNCKPGYPIKKLYQDAVLNFKKHKEEKNFIHNLGHGVGIDAHEFPPLGPSTEGVFKQGMVITIEPGLYYKNFGGVRIEDLCLIGKKCE